MNLQKIDYFREIREFMSHFSGKCRSSMNYCIRLMNSFELLDFLVLQFISCVKMIQRRRDMRWWMNEVCFWWISKHDDKLINFLFLLSDKLDVTRV